MNPDGWEGLQTVNPEIAEKQQVDKDDIDRLYLRVFASDDGAKLLTHLRSLTIEQPSWPATAMLAKAKTVWSGKLSGV
jgi:hypothetical protein